MRLRLAGCVAVALTLLNVSLGAQQYKNTFKDAFLAYEFGKWDEAERLFRKAIQENPRETGEQIQRTGMNFAPYRPHYYLVLTLYRAKKCVAGEQELTAARAQAAIREDSDLQRYRKPCAADIAASAAKPQPDPATKAAPPPAPPPVTTPPPPGPTEAERAAFNQAVRRAEDAINRAESAKKAVDDLSGDPLLRGPWRSNGKLGQEADAGAGSLQNARSELESAKKQPDLKRGEEAANNAAADAGRASSRFESVRLEGERVKAELTVVPVPPPTKAEPPPTKAEPPPSASSAAPKAPAPSDELRNAAVLYSQGRYKQAAETLKRVSVAADLQVPTDVLFSAALFGEYVTDGERNQALLQQARQQAQKARKSSPAFTPNPRVYSPRFLEFYRSAR